MEYGSEHRKAVCTGRETQECYVRTQDRTGTRIRTGTGTGTKLEMVILRTVLVIPKFECWTEFRESWELVWSCDSGASMADEFWGGTSAGGMTGDVTSLELAEVCQQSYVRVTGCNRMGGRGISWENQKALRRQRWRHIPLEWILGMIDNQGLKKERKKDHSLEWRII